MTDPVISDAVVEAACAVIREMCGKHMEPDNDVMIAALIAAILADRAETVEACAKVAEAEVVKEINRFLVDGKVIKDQHGDELFISLSEYQKIIASKSALIRSRVPCVPSNKDAG